MQANMSETVKSVSIIATARPASAIKKETPWTKRSTSWKLTDIFWLKVNTWEIKAKEDSNWNEAYILNYKSIFCTFKSKLHLEKNY